MNQVYRVVFNRSLGVWQCVAETAKARGKSSSKSFKALVVTMSLVSGGAMADDSFIDGAVHNYNNDIALNGNVLVSNPNTQLTTGLSNQIQFGAVNSAGQTAPTDANINNTAQVRSGGDVVIGIDSPANVNVDNASLFAEGTLVVGGKK